MSRTQWQSLNLSSSIAAKGLTSAKNAISPVISITETILEVAKKISQIVYNLYVDVSDPTALALKEAVEAIKAGLDTVFKDTGLYALPVPIRTVNDIVSDVGVLLVNQIEQPSSYWRSDDRSKSVTNQEQAIATTKAQPIQKQQQSQQLPGDLQGLDLLLANTPKGNGGNAGFLNTVIESLNDGLDSHRPQFNRDDYVAGMVLVYGASSYYDIIKLVKKLTALFRFKGSSLASPDMPKPKNLTARLEANPLGGTNTLYAVKLDWEAVPIAWPMRAYGDVNYDIKQVFIYRSKKPITQATPLSSLTKIDSYDYDGLTSSYYDSTWDSSMLGKPLYYAVGYRLAKIVNYKEVQESLPFEVSVAAVQMPANAATLVTRGVPPDWSATTLYSLIPALKTVVQIIKDTLDAWLEGTQGGKDRIKDFLDFLNKEIQRYANWAEEVLGTIQEIIDMFQLPSATMGLYFFEGRGGNAFLVKSLSEALSDTADPARPAFDVGTEMVGGLVLYAGAAVPGEAQQALNKIKALFGAGGVIESAWDNAVASIDRILNQAEAEICFNKEMLKMPCETETAPAAGFGADMQPADEDSTCSRTS